MNKLTILIILLVAFISCKGPGSGPLVKNSFSKNEESQNMNSQNASPKVALEKINITVDPCKDCIKISDLLANKKNFSGKTIMVKGQVTKYNPEIMGKNWIHIQDGSEFEGSFDLTITTDKQVSVGETITFEGRIVLDKDFGYGYFYNVLMEEAKSIL